MKQNPERYCSRADDDGHWYLIPESMSKEFDKLYSSCEESEEFDQKFSEYRLQGGIEHISFREPDFD